MTKLLKIFAILCLIYATQQKQEAFADDTYGGDHQQHYAGATGGPQWQAPMTKRYSAKEIIQHSPRSRYIGGDILKVRICCEFQDDFYGAQGTKRNDKNCVTYEDTPKMRSVAEAKLGNSTGQGSQQVEMAQGGQNSQGNASDILTCNPIQHHPDNPTTAAGDFFQKNKPANAQFGQGVIVRLWIKSPLGQVVHEDKLIDYQKVMCLTDHKISVQMLLSNKGISSSEVCVPESEIPGWNVATDLHECCLQPQKRYDSTGVNNGAEEGYDTKDLHYNLDYQINLHVQSAEKNCTTQQMQAGTCKCDPLIEPACPEKVKLIRFNQFDSNKIQTITEGEIITVAMGNTQDFPSLEDKITMCPTNLQDNGTTWFIPNICNQVNQVDQITCNHFQTVCPDNKAFYFRLTTPGEVYTLGMKNQAGEIVKAPGGAIPCKDIKSVNDIYVVNDNHPNSEAVTKIFHFGVDNDSGSFMKVNNYECLNPDQIPGLQGVGTPACHIKVVQDNVTTPTNASTNASEPVGQRLSFRNLASGETSWTENATSPLPDESRNRDRGYTDRPITCFISKPGRSATQNWKRNRVLIDESSMRELSQQKKEQCNLKGESNENSERVLEGTTLKFQGLKIEGRPENPLCPAVNCQEETFYQKHEEKISFAAAYLVSVLALQTVFSYATGTSKATK